MFENCREFKVGDIAIGGNNPLVLLAGLCVIENQEHLLEVAGCLKSICEDLSVPLIFKASFDKANRTSLESYRGPGLKRGLEMLLLVKEKYRLPILVDIHKPGQAEPAAQVADILQIPAFLCRQTDLIKAAGKTGRAVNVKKGQFLAPEDMEYVVKKLEGAGCEKILLTERGVSFGYRCLVNDMTSLPIMRSLGWPVVFDATHSVQKPGAGHGITGGARQHVPVLARAAVAAGCDGIFMEVHDHPEQALSDAASVFPLSELAELLKQLCRIDQVIKNE